MNGQSSVRALARRAVRWTVPAVVLAAAVIVQPPPPADAYNGGVSYLLPAAQPCVAPCTFVGDNTGAGLSGFPYGGYGNYNATWWSFTPTETRTYTFRANSISPAGWDNTLTLTDTSGNVVAHNDDSYGLDAMISPALTAGTAYRFALGGYRSDSTGTANVTISSSPPNAPAKPQGTEGDGSVTLTWSAPFDNYAAITSYRVYVNGSASVGATVTGTPPATGTTISGLTNGAAYTFRVSAVNANGEGPLSPVSNQYVPTGATTTTVAFSPASPTYGTTFSVVVTVSGSSVVNGGAVTLRRGLANLGAVTVVDGQATWAGESLPAGDQGYSANYGGTDGWLSSGSGSVSVTVGKAEQAITFDPVDDTALAAGSIEVAPTSSAELTVDVASNTTSVCTVAAGVVTLVTGGICSLTATQAGDDDHLAAVAVTRTFDVTDAPQTITFARPDDRAWSATTFDVAPSSSSGLDVTLAGDSPSVCTVSGVTVTLVRTGDCTLTATQAGDTHFVEASLSRTFVVTAATQAALTADAAAHELLVGGTTDLTTSGGSGDGEVAFAVTSGGTHCAVDGTVLTATAVGTCVVTATKAGDGRYGEATDDTAVVTVVQVTPTVVLTADPSVQAHHALIVTATVSGLVPGSAPGAVTLSLSGGSAGARADAPVGAVTLAGDGRSGTATFAVRAGGVGTLTLDAVLAGTAVYVEAAARQLRVDAVDVPPALLPTVPSRIVDTRPGFPHVRPAPDAKLAAGEVLEVQFTDLPGLVPATGVNAVTLAIGVVEPEGNGHVTAFPCGDVPDTSTLNFRTGQTVSNAAIVPVDRETGTVCFVANVATHLVVDVSGWSAVDDGFVDVAPTRLVDTRPGADALRPLTGWFEAGETRSVQVTDLDGLVPATGVAAIALNLTAVAPEGAGFVTAWACGERPNASSLNFTAGTTVANLAIVPVDVATGEICLHASQRLHLVVDLTGWFEPLHGFTPSGPDRVFDTRPGYSGRVPVGSGQLDAGQVLTVQVTGLDGLVPDGGVSAVSLNVTVVGPVGNGYVTVWACGDRPDTSSLNYVAGLTTAGAVIAPVDVGRGTICIASSQAAYLVVDVNGWFSALVN